MAMWMLSELHSGALVLSRQQHEEVVVVQLKDGHLLPKLSFVCEPTQVASEVLVRGSLVL